ncbi:MAG: hypothetical protein ERJ68_04570 [Aphanocapsa feldmannii 277cI]|uniref:Uncharacterized protein n=1 Tax=Aphanocapsa feldmannii 277cI TaxID=2507554 RepID=A0A524RUH1_9CHRO|nr:MAG: hypothetical protein ERJ68_04570 [Aphanocapsa feldmannii 277cI]
MTRLRFEKLWITSFHQLYREAWQDFWLCHVLLWQFSRVFLAEKHCSGISLMNPLVSYPLSVPIVLRQSRASGSLLERSVSLPSLMPRKSPLARFFSDFGVSNPSPGLLAEGGGSSWLSIHSNEAWDVQPCNSVPSHDLPERLAGRDPLLDRDVGEQGTAPLLLASHCSLAVILFLQI